MADVDPQPVGPGHKSPGPNPFFFAVLAAIPAAIFLGLKVGQQGTIAGSELALTVAASAIAFGLLYALLVIVREAWRRKAVTLGLPLGGKVEPQQEAADPKLAQHEAITKQAEAMEGVTSSITQQLGTTTEQLKSQTERGDALAEDNRRLVEENARLRGGPPGGEDTQEIRASRTNP